MCLAVPAEIVELMEGERATVSVGGVRKVISVSFVEEAKVGDFVLVHVGHALSKIDPEEARKTLELFEEIFGPDAAKKEVGGESS